MTWEEDCNECGAGSAKVQENGNGEYECHDCGLILGLAIDMGKDYRVFADGAGANNERHGMAATWLLHDKGLTTDICRMNKDSSGAPIKGEFRKRLGRLRRQQQRTRIRNSTERNLVQALYELQRLASQMGLNETIREQAAYIYRKAAEAKLVQGRSIEGVVAASIHAACRLNGIHRTLDEIGRHSRIGRKEIGRTYRKVKQQLHLRIAPSSAQGFVPAFCSKLQVPPAIEAEAMAILAEKKVKKIATGRSPTGIAAAVVYLSCMKNPESYRTQRDVAAAAGVTEVTIRNRYNDICDALEIDRNTLGQ